MSLYDKEGRKERGRKGKGAYYRGEKSPRERKGSSLWHKDANCLA